MRLFHYCFATCICLVVSGVCFGATIKLPKISKKHKVSSDVKGAAAMSMKVKMAFFTLSSPIQLRGCAWSWSYTNTLNGYFRIEATTNLVNPNWQVVTNTLWMHYVEQPIQQHYFRGWYMHNLYGMIPIRTGN